MTQFGQEGATVLTTKHASGIEFVIAYGAALALMLYGVYADGRNEKEEKEAARAPGTPGVDSGPPF